MSKRHPNLTLLLTLTVLLLTPAPSHAATASTDERYFPETNHSVVGKFLHYWQDNGGLARFGYPISEEMDEVSALDGRSYGVQYFERAEFEHHPLNQPPYDVELTQLGTIRYRAKYPHGASGEQPNRAYNRSFFPDTDKHLGGAFQTYWQEHGGLTLFGFPISEEFYENSAMDGKAYKVQYFERAVFEYHPENGGSQYEVLLSQLGRFSYAAKYQAGPSPLPTPVQLANANDLISLSLISATEGWTISSGGAIFHLTGGQWQAVTSPAPIGSYLSSIAMTAPDDGWIVGAVGIPVPGLALHYVQGEWQYANIDNLPPLNAVDMVSKDEGWALGSSSPCGAEFWQYKAGHWTSYYVTCDRPDVDVLYAISMDSSDDGWAVGNVMYHYNKNGWDKQATPTKNRLSGVKMLSSSEGWAVSEVGEIFHYQDDNWMAVPSPVDTCLSSISMVSKDEGWAVGCDGVILHYKESSWSLYSSPTSKYLRSIQMIGANEGWAVGGDESSAVILHYQNGTWSIYQ